MADIPPNETIYIKGLEAKIKKEEVKRSLYCLFSQYGRILDVIACKTPKLRGQAWVVFSEVTAATNALRHMKDFRFYDKPMSIQYAKTKSDAILSLLDDSYNPKEKRRKLDEKERRKRDAEMNGTQPRVYGATPLKESMEEASKAASSAGKTSDAAPPNSILFIQNLPEEATGLMLRVLFQQYPGFKEVRTVEAKPGIAFVEYNDDAHATVALEALQGFKITAKNAMDVSYAKK